jgi:hypothetical protein
MKKTKLAEKEKPSAQIIEFKRKKWSGRQDLNLRPHAPQACALPGCATPRFIHQAETNSFGGDFDLQSDPLEEGRNVNSMAGISEGTARTNFLKLLPRLLARQSSA